MPKALRVPDRSLRIRPRSRLVEYPVSEVQRTYGPLTIERQVMVAAVIEAPAANDSAQPVGVGGVCVERLIDPVPASDALRYSTW